MTAKAKMTPAERVAALELEYERLKEKADFLDATLSGDHSTWLGIRTILENAKHIGSIEIDKAVTEARQTALAMASVAKTLASLVPAEIPVQDVDPLKKMEDEVARKRAEKLA